MRINLGIFFDKSYRENPFKYAYRLLRKAYYFTFRKDYILAKKREHVAKGLKCEAHGCCGKMIIVPRCFDVEKNSCTLWGTDKFPEVCQLTPFDEKDLGRFHKEHGCPFK